MTPEEEQRIKELLRLKNAPGGAVASDFKTALYVVACLYHIEFKGASVLGMCSHLMGAVGFKGHIADYRLPDYEAALSELTASGALVPLGDSDSYAAPGQTAAVTSEVRAVPDGGERQKSDGAARAYIFRVRDERGVSCRLKSRMVILPGDVVEAVCVRDAGLAYVTRLVKKRVCVLGRVQLIGHKERCARLLPDEPSLQAMEFEIPSREDLGGARAGDVVIAEITKRLSGKFTVRVREIVHDIGDLSSIIVMAVLRNDIPSSWPAGVEKVLARVPAEVQDTDRRGRADLRDLPLITIDGEDARDFDDAVCCEKTASGFRLYVAIADVSYYVRPGTLLDSEARLRCNSCYFPNFVIPMLPEKLSNGICSLNPDVERLCMVCELAIDERGRTADSRFYPALMRSHGRLTYTEAWRMIRSSETDVPEHRGLIGGVKTLYELYGALCGAREERGGISIESEELRFIFNENLEIAGVESVERNPAHKLIEECMIAANVAAAEFVSARNAAALYRVHARPGADKLGLLTGQLARFGLHLPARELQPKDFAALARSVENRPDRRVIAELILRSMSKAEYSPDNIGHFGLALEKYAHFTSPIRRYADLQLHRVIKHLLEKEQRDHPWGRIGALSYGRQELVALGVSCTEREIGADNAEREVDATLACVYARGFIGETVRGTITGCNSFGVFVHLDEIGADGLIYIGSFSEYLTYDAATQTLRDTASNRVYAPGQSLSVTIAAVNVDERKIDLLPPGARAPKASLAKARQKALDESAALKRKYPAADKQSLLDRLADISRPRDALSEDEAVKAVPDREDWLGELLGSAHSENPLKMPQSAYDLAKRKRSGSRKKKN